MNFSLVFENTNDELPFMVVNNKEVFRLFLEQIDSRNQNSFSFEDGTYRLIDKNIANLHWAISKTNEVLYDLINVSFAQPTDLVEYLDQKFLNNIHSDWVFSHRNSINIDEYRFNGDLQKSKLGCQLHELYPDNIRVIQTAPALEKLGYLYPFHEVNLGVHRLESSFSKIEFLADDKWEVFDNLHIDSMITNNDIVNFSFGYTYVGRQFYNKFRFFDTDLEYPDNFNYEQLELAFQVSLSRPETIPFSKEAREWADKKGIALVAEQIPIANLVDIDKNLFEYRKIIYRNSKNKNRARIITT